MGRTFALVALTSVLLCIDAGLGLNIAITGTSQGIGSSAAAQLISQGHRVIHGCRSKERADLAVESAGGGEGLVCDLADLSSVRTFAAEVRHLCGEEGLDVLCLNAGIAPSTRRNEPELTKDGFESCIGEPSNSSTTVPFLHPTFPVTLESLLS